MAEYPAMPWWTDAYLADTRHLSTIQHGAYCLLLMEAWRRPHCNLPDNDEILAKLTGLSAAEWAVHRPVIMAFWKLDLRTLLWQQKRQKKERKFVDKTSARQRSAAKARWNKEKAESHGNATSMPNGYHFDAPTPTPTPTVEELPSGVVGASAPPALKVVSRKVGERLPQDWCVLDEDWDRALADGLTNDELHFENAQFKDHWWTKSGKDATKIDWDRTWQKWMRKAAHDKREKQQRQAAWDTRSQQRRQ